jgi:hypothetical protein
MAIRRMASLLVVAFLSFASVAYAQDVPAEQSASTRAGADLLYPDPALTPGATFNDVTADQVCAAGYSASVRDVTAADRAQVYEEYGLVDAPGADEVDHFVPLELGGSNDITNLWPEPYTAPGADEKDRVENYLHGQVCSGVRSLSVAQQMIMADWYAVYLTLPTEIQTAPEPATEVATPQPSLVTVPVTHAVSFVSVTGGRAGGRASVTIQTSPGDTCWIQYVTPLGTKSTAQGQGAAVSRVANADGQASWSWLIGTSTRSGTGSVTATCSTGSVSAPITIG